MYEKILNYRDNLTFIPVTTTTTTTTNSHHEGEEERKEISREAKEIMQALIRANGKDRMTVSDLLNQPWMMTTK